MHQVDTSVTGAPRIRLRRVTEKNTCYGKKIVHFETALNVVWLVLGSVALAFTAHAAFRRKPEDRHAPAWLHVVGVGLIVAALFPYISATDDVVRIEHFHSQHDSHHSGKRSKTEDLIRLYEALETAWISPVSQALLILFFVALVFSPTARLIERIAPLKAGRSPPLVAW
jgi:hypothetical protein